MECIYYKNSHHFHVHLHTHLFIFIGWILYLVRSLSEYNTIEETRAPRRAHIYRIWPETTFEPIEEIDLVILSERTKHLSYGGPVERNYSPRCWFRAIALQVLGRF